MACMDCDDLIAAEDERDRLRERGRRLEALLARDDLAAANDRAREIAERIADGYDAEFSPHGIGYRTVVRALDGRTP